jgi:hypothetical protein
VDKVNVIKQMESGKRKADVCWDSVNSTTQIIWKKGDKIVKCFGRGRDHKLNNYRRQNGVKWIK